MKKAKSGRRQKMNSIDRTGARRTGTSTYYIPADRHEEGETVMDIVILHHADLVPEAKALAEWSNPKRGCPHRRDHSNEFEPLWCMHGSYRFLPGLGTLGPGRALRRWMRSRGCCGGGGAGRLAAAAERAARSSR